MGTSNRKIAHQVVHRWYAIILVISSVMFVGCGTQSSPDTVLQNSQPSAPLPSATPRQSSLPSPPPGDGITADEARRQKLGSPAEVRLEQTDAGVRITWPGIGVEISHYQIYRMQKDGAQWQPLAQVQATPRNRDMYEFRDAASLASDIVYGVTAVSPNRRESNMVTTDGQTIQTPLP